MSKPVRRLVMIRINGCQWCETGECENCGNNEHTNLFYVGDATDHMGFQSCNCHIDVARQHAEKFVMPNNQLLEILGDREFSITRSSGKLEAGWKIENGKNAFRFTEESDFLVPMRKDDLTKLVFLSELKQQSNISAMLNSLNITEVVANHNNKLVNEVS